MIKNFAAIRWRGMPPAQIAEARTEIAWSPFSATTKEEMKIGLG